ncbi:hypothetical protein [Nostoc sp.]
MIELGTGDWEDWNRDSDPNQFKNFFPSTQYPVPERPLLTFKLC